MELGTAINGWLAFAGVVAGGALTKLIDRYFAVHEQKIKSDDDRRKELSLEEAGFRTELRSQIQDLRKEIIETRAQVGDLQVMVDDWRDKYYQNVAENLDLNSRYARLQNDYNALTGQYKDLETKYSSLGNLQEKYDTLKLQFEELLRRVKEAGIQIT